MDETRMGASEVRRKWSQVMDRIRAGERITITRRGVRVAVLTPVPIEQPHPPVEDVIVGLKEFRKNHTLGGITIRELIEEGRRERMNAIFRSAALDNLVDEGRDNTEQERSDNVDDHRSL